MIIKDKVYGDVEVAEPLLLELMGSAPMQRVKGVYQQGFVKEMLYPGMPFFSRYDHCVGAMLAIRKVGGGLLEQAAGLLHDVSHTAFSHTIDRVLGDPTKEAFQDENHLSYIEGTEIKGILERHGYEPEDVADLESFTLLDSHAPALCADRIDYTLRDCAYGTNPEAVPFCVEGISRHEDRFVFADKAHAKAFALNYINCYEKVWVNHALVVKSHLLAGVLKDAIKEGAITVEDLKRSTDYAVLDKIRRDGASDLSRRLDELNGDVKFAEVGKGEGGVHIPYKLRYIDPEYMDGGGVAVLSKTDEEYRSALEACIARHKDGMYARC